MDDVRFDMTRRALESSREGHAEAARLAARVRELERKNASLRDRLLTYQAAQACLWERA
jgi:hypothetical protein